MKGAFLSHRIAAGASDGHVVCMMAWRKSGADESLKESIFMVILNKVQKGWIFGACRGRWGRVLRVYRRHQRPGRSGQKVSNIVEDTGAGLHFSQVFEDGEGNAIEGLFNVYCDNSSELGGVWLPEDVFLVRRATSCVQTSLLNRTKVYGRFFPVSRYHSRRSTTIFFINFPRRKVMKNGTNVCRGGCGLACLRSRIMNVPSSIPVGDVR